MMAQTQAQKKAAAEKAANQKLLAQAQSLLAQKKSTLASLEKSQATVKKIAAEVKSDTPTLAELGNIGTQSLAASTDALAAGDAAAAAGDAAVLAGNASLGAINEKVLTPQEIAKLVKQYTKESISAMNEQQKTEERLSAFNILRMEFEQYGLGSLVTDIKDLLMNNTPPSEFGLRLRGTEAYQKRFAGNDARIKAGLAALSPAEYVGLEDQYQNVMRNYGLPATYYTKDQTGKQAGFEKFIAGDVSATELENRIITAQDRVINANPEVAATLKAFYPDITNGDILAYTLDPQNALKDIQRKVTAAEIGGAATSAGLNLGKTPEQIAASKSRAQMLAGYGVTKEAAMTGFQTVAEVAPRGSQLAEFYNRPTYGQMEAEQEVFNLEGSTAARKRRKELTSLEQAAFSKKSGLGQGALNRERAGNL
jgi:hypothetical protein